MRALRAGMSPSELEESELMGPGFGYYNGKLLTSLVRSHSSRETYVWAEPVIRKLGCVSTEAFRALIGPILFF